MVSKKRFERFNEEFKKAVATAIAAAMGLVTALAWRDVMNEYLVSKVSAISPFQGLLISAIIITLISVLVIMWSSTLTSEKPKDKKSKKK